MNRTHNKMLYSETPYLQPSSLRCIKLSLGTWQLPLCFTVSHPSRTHNLCSILSVVWLSVCLSTVDCICIRRYSMGKFMPGQSWSYFANDIIKCIVSNKICNSRKANSHKRVPLDLTEHGTFVRYVKLRIVYAPGRSGTFSSPPRVSDPDVHHGTCVTHVPCWMSESLTRGFLWTQWRGNRSLHPGACTTRNFAYLVRRQLVYEIYENIM